MPSVLLGNDDGIYAPGLHALADAFWADGWRVSICAPDGERSGASHSIVIGRPIIAARVELDRLEKVAAWKCDGKPGDCVKLALLELCEERPDLVVAGVNDGWNVGSDIHYSGTFGAAMEAAFEGVPAMAVSARYPDTARYRYAAALAVRLAGPLLESRLPMPSVLNVNVPDCAADRIRGVVEAPLTHIRYTDAYDKMERPPRRAAYWLRGDIIKEGCLPGGDLDCLLKGFVTVTAVGWDMTVRDMCGGILRNGGSGAEDMIDRE